MIADVSSAFLHAWVAESLVIIIRPPAGYRGADGEECLWMLRRMLYGLRDAPAAWQDTFAEILVEQGFVRGRYESSIYMHPTKQLTLVVHVDDFHLTGPDEEMLKLMVVPEKVLVIKHQGPFGPGDSYTFLRAATFDQVCDRRSCARCPRHNLH